MKSSNLRKIRHLFFLSTCLVAVQLTGCTPKPNGTESAAQKELNLSIWTNYVAPETLKKFTDKTGIKVNVSYYASNEELLAKVQAGSTGIDVAVPSDYMVKIMTQLELLSALDKGKIPNMAGLDAQVMGQEFDPTNSYSLPYNWSTAGLAIHRDLYKGKIASWKDFFSNKDLSGKISLLDDVRETMAIALKLHGYSVNSTDLKQLKEAAESLKLLKSRVKMFRSDMRDSLINKEVAVAHIYSTDALRARAQSAGKIEYILPEEGGTRAIDNLVILKDSKNRDSAHAFINFLLSPEVNLEFVKTYFGGPVVMATKDLLPPEIRNNPVIFPPPQVLKKFESLRDLGDATTKYDRIWTEIKSER